MEAAQDSISTTVAGLKCGDKNAVEVVFARYFDMLVRKAKRRLGQGMERARDAEDIAVEALCQFFDRAKRDGFRKLKSSDDVRSLLLLLADRRAIDFKRTVISRRANEVGESILLDPIDPKPFDPEDLRPPASYVESFGLAVVELLEKIGDETLRGIAVMRLEGWSNAEIARTLKLSERSIERKLERIRGRLEGAAEAEEKV